jgi:hypothetical protein
MDFKEAYDNYKKLQSKRDQLETIINFISEEGDDYDLGSMDYVLSILKEKMIHTEEDIERYNSMYVYNKYGWAKDNRTVLFEDLP